MSNPKSLAEINALMGATSPADTAAAREFNERLTSLMAENPGLDGTEASELLCSRINAERGL